MPFIKEHFGVCPLPTMFVIALSSIMWHLINVFDDQDCSGLPVDMNIIYLLCVIVFVFDISDVTISDTVLTDFSVWVCCIVVILNQGFELLILWKMSQWINFQKAQEVLVYASNNKPFLKKAALVSAAVASARLVYW